MMIPARLLSFFSLCLFLFVFTAPHSATAEAKQYYIEELNIEAQILESGRVMVSETRRVRFNGSYSWLEQRFRREGFTDMENIEVRIDGEAFRFNPEGRDDAVPGEFSVRETDNSIYVRAHLAAENETVDMELRYVLRGALVFNEEWAEFYWRFLGSGWSRPTEDISLQLDFPDAPADQWNQLHVWHNSPAIDTNLRIRDTGWTFTAGRIRDGRSISMRTIFPSAWVDDAAMLPTEVELHPEAVQAKIDAEIQAAQQARERKQAQAAFLVPLSYALAVFALVLAGFMLYKYRFNHPQGGGARQQVPPMADRPPSSLPPALAGRLLGMNYSSAEYRLLGTIFDLGRKGYFTFEQSETGKSKKKPGFLVSRTDKIPDSELYEWERQALEFVERRLAGQTKSFKEIFDNKPDLSLKLKKGKEKLKSKKQRKDPASIEDVSQWLAEWDKRVGEDAKARGWWVDNDKPMAVLLTIELVLLVSGLILMIYLDDVASVAPGLTLMGGSLAGVFMAFGLQMRTPEGDERYQEWMAYRKGLKEQRVTADQAFKGRHIVYALALGISGKKFDALIGSLDIQRDDFSWMLFMPGVFPNAAMFSSALGEAVSATASSVAAGTGGGAVGGAAGGGGGGGAG